MSLSLIHTGGHRDNCVAPSSYPGGRKPRNHSHGNRPGVIEQEIQSETEDRKYKQALREPLSGLDKVSNNLVNE